MNIVKITRKNKGVTVKEMATVLNMKAKQYKKAEKTCSFSINDYFKICDILNIDFDTHI